MLKGEIVFVVGILYLLTIIGLDMGEQLMLWPFWRGMSKSDEGVLDVVHHGEVDQPRIVVPIEVNPKVTLAAPIIFNGV